MQIKVFSGFSKRINSTKQPTGGTTVDVLLKDDCSILNPTFILNTLDFSINYVQAFGNYYFCDVRNLDGHRSELNCSLDHLATFKTQIASYRGFVEYTSSSSKLTITDPRNMPTGEIIHSNTPMQWSSGFSFNQTGCYILAFLSDTATTGLVSYIALDWYGLHQLAFAFFTQTIIDEILKQFSDITNSLVSLIWLPFALDDMASYGTYVSSIHIGSKDVQISDTGGYLLTSRIRDFSTSATILTFPVAPYDFDITKTYLSRSPYTTAELFLPFVGNIPLSDDLISWLNNGIYIDGSVDLFTGDIVYKLHIGDEKTATYNGCISTSMPISSASYNAFGVATGSMVAVGGVASAIVGIATLNPAMVAGGVAGAASGASSIAKSAQIHTQISGSNSSAIGLKLGSSPIITVYCNVAAEKHPLNFKTEQGMPYCETAQLGTLSGFIKCSTASVSIPGDGSEQNTVNGYLNSGFYYE